MIYRAVSAPPKGNRAVYARQTPLAVMVIVAVCAAVLVTAYFGARRPTAIRLAYQNRIASAIVIVAVEQRFFAHEGLVVQPLRFNSGPACSEALFSGSADIGTMGDATAVIAVSRGAPLTIIASHGCGEHRHRIVVAADSPISDVADLVGKRVGVKKGTSTYGGFLALLAQHQVDPDGLWVIDMRPADMPEALVAGSVDAFVASEPTPSLAEVQGACELATLGGLGNTYPILVLASHDLIARSPEKLPRFLRALRRAEQFVQAQPEHTATVLARVTGLSPELARQAIRRHTYEIRLDETIRLSLKQTAVFLQTQGIIPQVPDFEVTIATEYLTSSLAGDPE